MGSHDIYGKKILLEATNGQAKTLGATVEVDYGAGYPARIDGTFENIAIEIESRTSKQVRGAVLDLICHSFPKKLLLLLPVHMSNPEVAATQCRSILDRLCGQNTYEVLVLTGHGDNPNPETDTALIREAIARLRD